MDDSRLLRPRQTDKAQSRTLILFKQVVRRETLSFRRPAMQNFIEAVVEFGAAIRSGRLLQYSNPMLGRCIGNVVGKPDRRGNLYPTKARPEQQIDAAVVLIMTTGRTMAVSEQFTSVFELAELWPAWRRSNLCELNDAAARSLNVGHQGYFLSGRVSRHFPSGV